MTRWYRLLCRVGLHGWRRQVRGHRLGCLDCTKAYNRMASSGRRQRYLRYLRVSSPGQVPLRYRLFYQVGPVCFACGRWGSTPCPGHEYGGTILAMRARRVWRPVLPLVLRWLP